MAASDDDRSRRAPRLRTANGFVISALYANRSAPDAPPVGLLVECPADLVEVFRGQRARVLVAGQWVELGEIDVGGKATGDLPEGIEFKPPFGFRVGNLEEEPREPTDRP